MEKHTYNVNISWTQDRKGVMCSPELHNKETNESNCLEVATPPEFPGGMPNIWSPEHLFTAAVSSCLMTTFLAIAEYSKLDYVSFKCDSKGVLEKVDGKFVMSEILLFPEVVITDESKRDRTERIVEKSEKACLISNSIKSKVTMETKIIVQN
ncbi:peroxiredoxin-like protein [Winogradskyella epiphytica]|uniref:Peroxiredoxin-like protein n=1 Tax=Winogradskyella epiphytica TaxID=262005 RepID=A0A2V4XJU5_9FLAO|nr:OsmC family protein [Winogradskyella epiphytica]PYE81933.1 peroxiredoxin-like protein [Winogradskyella epiphytica]GGW61721.1 redox protein OsmC [Winogradskyella epiphytica]